MNYRADVVTISMRASRGEWEDTSGPEIVNFLRKIGLTTSAPKVIADGEIVATTLEELVSQGSDLIITTGGTGHTPNDLTPEMTRRVINRDSPGIAEAIRAYGLAHGVPTAALSRAIAGISGKTLIINLPGSLGGVRDGIKVLKPMLLHALDQIHGGDHQRKN